VCTIFFAMHLKSYRKTEQSGRRQAWLWASLRRESTSGWHLHLESDLNARTVGAAEAAAVIKSGDWIRLWLRIGQPDVSLRRSPARICISTDSRFAADRAQAARKCSKRDPDARHASISRVFLRGGAQDTRTAILCSHFPIELR